MILLTSASFPHYGLERFFQFAQKAGAHGVEILVNQNYDTQNPEYIQKLVEEYNLPVRALSLPDKGAEKHLKAFQRVAEAFPKVHVNLASAELFSSSYKSWITKTMPRAAKHHKFTLNRRNSEFKLLLGFIPLRSENSLYALKQAGTVSLDTSALASSNQDIIRAIKVLGKRLSHVYLSNVDRGKPYSAPMSGILPLESFLTKLAQNDFAGDITLKLSPQAIREGDEERMLEVLTRSKAFIEKYFVAKPMA